MDLEEAFFANPEKLAKDFVTAGESLQAKEALIATHQQSIQKVRDEIKQTHRLYVEGHIGSGSGLRSFPRKLNSAPDGEFEHA